MGGSSISGNNDTGMYRSWDQDIMYASNSGHALTPFYEIPIMYTVDTPNYTAPKLAYQTQRSSIFAALYQTTQKNELLFTVFVNNQTTEQEVDQFQWTQGRGYPVYKDYVVFVNPPNGRKRKQDLWLALHPSPHTNRYHDKFLNGLEVFKMRMNDNLATPNQELSLTTSPATPTLLTKGKRKKTLYVAILGGVGGAKETKSP
nr:receptor-like protein kinase FERONIA [Tanacetum cinerariifolium]